MLLKKGNRKLQYTAKANKCLCYTFSLSPRDTCPFAWKCLGYCYAECLAKLRPNVKQCYQRNTITSMGAFFESKMSFDLMYIQSIAKGIPIVIRLHDSGDFYSPEYVEKWRRVIALFPEITFYTYSKSHRWLDDMPSNFYFIPSLGGKDDNLILGRPHAKVVPENYQLKRGEIFGTEDEISNLYSVIVNKKTLCLKAHGAKRGLVR